MNDNTKTKIMIISLVIGLVGSLAGTISSYVTFQQYEASKPHLEIYTDEGKYFPIDKQPDKYAVLRYRVYIHAILTNSSTLPITITHATNQQ